MSYHLSYLLYPGNKMQSSQTYKEIVKHKIDAINTNPHKILCLNICGDIEVALEIWIRHFKSNVLHNLAARTFLSPIMALSHSKSIKFTKNHTMHAVGRVNVKGLVLSVDN